jgi:hypothetical protein
VGDAADDTAAEAQASADASREREHGQGVLSHLKEKVLGKPKAVEEL